MNNFILDVDVNTDSDSVDVTSLNKLLHIKIYARDQVYIFLKTVQLNVGKFSPPDHTFSEFAVIHVYIVGDKVKGFLTGTINTPNNGQ